MANDYDYPAYSGPHGPFVFSDGSISEFTCKCGKLLGNCHDAVIDSAYNETDCIRVWASIADSRPRLLAVFSPEEWADASISVQKRPFTEWGEPFGPPIGGK